MAVSTITPKIPSSVQSTNFTQPTLTNGTHYNDGCLYIKVGCFVFLFISVVFSSAPTNTVIFTLPARHRPAAPAEIVVSGGGSFNAKAQCAITTAGEVKVTSVDKWVIGSGVIIVY